MGTLVVTIFDSFYQNVMEQKRKGKSHCANVNKICLRSKMVLREIACRWKRRVKDRVSGSKKCGGRDVWMVCQGCFLLLQLTSQVRHWRRRNKKVRLNDHGCTNRRVPLRIV